MHHSRRGLFAQKHGYCFRGRLGSYLAFGTDCGGRLYVLEKAPVAYVERKGLEKA